MARTKKAAQATQAAETATPETTPAVKLVAEQAPAGEAGGLPSPERSSGFAQAGEPMGRSMPPRDAGDVTERHRDRVPVSEARTRHRRQTATATREGSGGRPAFAGAKPWLRAGRRSRLCLRPPRKNQRQPQRRPGRSGHAPAEKSPVPALCKENDYVRLNRAGGLG